MIEIGREIPASVQLLPAKKYNGSPIGVSYDVRVYAISCNDGIDERIQKRSTVKLGVKLLNTLCVEKMSNYNEYSPSSQNSTIPRLRLKLSPRARKLVKHTSLIMHGEYKNINSNFTEDNQMSVSETNIRTFKVQLFYYLLCIKITIINIFLRVHQFKLKNLLCGLKVKSPLKHLWTRTFTLMVKILM